jgi:hypothetical protein
MRNTARDDLHALVDALPPGEAQAARRYLEYLRDLSDPYAHLDGRDPFENASLEQAESEIAAGKGIPVSEVQRALRVAR